MADKIRDPLGNLVEVQNVKPGDPVRTTIVNNVFRDPSGNVIQVDKPMDTGLNFNSVARNPKKIKEVFLKSM